MTVCVGRNKKRRGEQQKKKVGEVAAPPGRPHAPAQKRSSLSLRARARPLHPHLTNAPSPRRHALPPGPGRHGRRRPPRSGRGGAGQGRQRGPPGRPAGQQCPDDGDVLPPHVRPRHPGRRPSPHLRPGHPAAALQPGRAGCGGAIARVGLLQGERKRGSDSHAPRLFFCAPLPISRPASSLPPQLNRTHDAHMFYMYFESRSTTPEDDPLVR